MGIVLRRLRVALSVPLSRVGLLLMGNYSDLYGRKVFLLFSLTGSLVGTWCLFVDDVKVISCKGGRERSGSSFFGERLRVSRRVPRSSRKRGCCVFRVTRRLIADCTLPSERNKYLAYLEATIAAASVLGPAIGGVLGQKNYDYPLYFAGGVAGFALIFASIFLDESNKDVHEIYEIRRSVKGKGKGCD